MLGAQQAGDFYASPLIGFRTWRMDEEALALTGVVMCNFHWPAVEDASAVCLPFSSHRKQPHDTRVVPVKECNCGFYGYKDWDVLRHASTCAGNHVNSIRGAAIGWGKCWLAEKGWRAKYARPVALLHWPERRNAIRDPFSPHEHAAQAFKWNEIAGQIAERYGIPIVHSPADLEDIARQYQ